MTDFGDAMVVFLIGALTGGAVVGAFCTVGGL